MTVTPNELRAVDARSRFFSRFSALGAPLMRHVGCRVRKINWHNSEI